MLHSKITSYSTAVQKKQKKQKNEKQTYRKFIFGSPHTCDLSLLHNLSNLKK